MLSNSWIQPLLILTILLLVMFFTRKRHKKRIVLVYILFSIIGGITFEMISNIQDERFIFSARSFFRSANDFIGGFLYTFLISLSIDLVTRMKRYRIFDE